MQNEKIATRVAYGRALAALGEKYDFFVMDADLSGSTQTAMFGKKFPERFANCGIAEENMVSTAAGIASTGLPVFVSSFAMFACGRAYEQIRNSVAYPRLNVKIAASHAGAFTHKRSRPAFMRKKNAQQNAPAQAPSITVTTANAIRFTTASFPGRKALWIRKRPLRGGACCLWWSLQDLNL